MLREIPNWPGWREPETTPPFQLPRAQPRHSTCAMVDQLFRERLEAGVCRHCGGPVPCWSPDGDVAVGVAAAALV